MPKYCQTPISEMVGSAVIALPSSGKPTMPHSGLMISRQMKPTITTDSVAGMNSSVR